MEAGIPISSIAQSVFWVSKQPFLWLRRAQLILGADRAKSARLNPTSRVSPNNYILSIHAHERAAVPAEHGYSLLVIFLAPILQINFAWCGL